jgi:hypothetical protein
MSFVAERLSEDIGTRLRTETINSSKEPRRMKYSAVLHAKHRVERPTTRGSEHDRKA